MQSLLPRITRGVHSLMTLLLILLLRDEISDLIERLGDDRIEVREQATAVLKTKGKRIESRLRDVKTDDEEVKVRVGALLRYVRELHTGPVRVRLLIDEQGAVEIEIREHGRTDPSFSSFVLGDRPVFDICVAEPGEWHPVEYAGWRAEILRQLDRPFETDVPPVYHLLTRARGFDFALPKLKSLKTEDPVMKRVIRRAIEKQEERR